MSDLLDELGVTEPRSKWTERMMLDLIHQRHAKGGGNGDRYVVAEHVRNQGGFGGYWGSDQKPLRTADAMVIDLWPSAGHLVHGFEVKVSRSDWLHELKDPDKAEAFVRRRAPRLDRQPMSIGMTAAWLRATAKTAARGAR